MTLFRKIHFLLSLLKSCCTHCMTGTFHPRGGCIWVTSKSLSIAGHQQFLFRDPSFTGRAITRFMKAGIMATTWKGFQDYELCAVQWWEFSLIIKADGFCSVFYRWLSMWYLCISMWELRSLMNIGLIPFNSIGFFFLLLSLRALNWAFRPCAQHLSRLFPGSTSPGTCLF